MNKVFNELGFKIFDNLFKPISTITLNLNQIIKLK